ncbi:MAG: protein kinase [Anaerolineae bacterium]
MTARYERGDLLGAGAMGEVYRGTDTQTGDTVAIKRLKASLVERDPTALERFIREGEALRRLDHPNIVKMLDAVTQGSEHLIVMEYVPGGTLREFIQQHPAMPIDTALDIAIQLADALTRSHYLAIIHRDIKPANILMTPDAVPKLTDFGIARFAQAEDSPTATGMVLGTYAYLSPEGCMGLPLDGRADIWAFGVVLYEMLTGQRPFTASSPGALIVEILKNTFPDPQDLRPDIPDGLNDLLYRMLTKQRDGRIPSVRLVGAEIEALLKGTPLRPAAALTEPETTAMFATPTSEQVGHNLPHQTTPFVGRTAELAELQRLLADDGVRLITLHGPGGMGKTRLAIEAARTRLGTYTDGVYLIELAPLTDAANIPHAIGEVVGYPFMREGAPAEQIVMFLANKQMLLILDNFEHILAGRQLANAILKAAPNVKLLTTSREQLNLTGESVFTLGGMDFPTWETPADALQYSAVKLFMQAAQRARIDFELEAEDLDYLARICRLVRGTPLGIILAAGWVDTLPLADIAAEIGESLDFLETEITDLPDRQRSIRATFDYSWNLLSEAERDAFARLSVFRGSCTYRAAKQVAGASLRMLTTLANKSLLGRNPTSGRFEIHELLRQLAAEHLDQQGQASTIRAAHAAYYLKALAARAGELKGADQVGAAADIEIDFENVRTAWQWALNTGLHDLLREAIPALWLFNPMRSRFEDARAMLAAAEARASDDRLLWAYAAVHHDLIDTLGRTLTAARAAIFREAIVLAEEHDDTYLAMLAHRALGLFHHLNGDAQAGFASYQTALGLASDPYFQATLSHDIGFAYHILGQIDQSREWSQKAVTLRREQGDLYGLSASLNNLGSLENIRRNQAKAAAYYEEAIAMANRTGDQLRRAFPIGNLANVYLLLGELEKSRALALECLALGDRLNHDRTRAMAYGALSGLALSEGDNAQSEVWTTKQLALGRNDPQVTVPAMLQRALAASTRGRYEAAKADIRQVVKLAPPRSTLVKSMVLRSLTPLVAANGEAERAVEIFGLVYATGATISAETEVTPLLLELRDRLRAELGEEAFRASGQRVSQMDLFAVYDHVVAAYLAE